LNGKYKLLPINELIKKYSNKFVKDSFWLLGAKIAEITIAILINIYVAKKYGNEGIGIFNQVFAFFLIFTIISNLGVSNSIVKYTSEKFEKSQTVLIEHYKITLILSLPLTGLIILAIYFMPFLFSNAQVADSILIISFALPLFLINKNYLSFLNGRRKINDLALLRLLRWISVFLGTLFISFITNEINNLFYTFIFSESIVLAFIQIKYNGLSLFSFNKKIRKKYLNFSLKTLIAEITATVNDRLGIVLLGYVLSKNDIGVYSLLLTITSSLYYVQQVVMQNVNPIVSNLYFERKFSELQYKVNKIMKVTGVISLILSLLLIPAYYILTHFILTNQLDGYFITFLLMLLAALIFAPFAWTGGMLIMAGYVRENFYRILAIMCMNILSLLIFGYYFGLSGAVAAIFVLNLFIVFLQNYTIKKFMHINII
jgi:O-antigen/teichoic acid export membrane protein